MLDLRVMRIALATLLWVTSLADCSVSDGCFEDDVALELLQARWMGSSTHQIRHQVPHGNRSNVRY